MFGSAVPVCAVNFPALPELVKNGENGIIFRSHSELAAHLYRLFCDSPNEKRSTEELFKMRKNAFNIGKYSEVK
jgi:beta-1,4-mannosyltransferase